MANPRPKRHHFLPKDCYFNAFKAEESLVDNPFIWVHEAGKEPQLRSINNTAVEKDFYTFYDGNGNPNTELEQQLAATEARLSITIKKLIENRGDYGFSPEERNDIAEFIGMMIMRSPRYKQQSRIWIREFKKACEAVLAGKIPTILESVTTAGDQIVFRNWLLSFTNKEIEEYLDRMPSEETVFTELLWKDCHKNARIIYEEMHWMFLIPLNKGTEFATSDAPVNRHEPHKGYLGAGLAQPDVILYFPISPDLCFYALKNFDVPVRRDASSQFQFSSSLEVEMVNYYLVMSTNRYLYSRSRNINVEKFLLERFSEDVEKA